MTPERDAVTRAREAVGIAVARCIIATTNDESSEAVSATLVTSLDAYAAAIRAALLAEVVAVVAGMPALVVKGDEIVLASVTIKAYETALDNAILRDDTLTAIRALTEAR